MQLIITTVNQKGSGCMSLKKWKNVFTKREFVKLIFAVARKNMREFNYTKMPYIMEKKLEGDCVMCFYGDGKFTAIAYDYAKFKRKIGDDTYKNQYSLAVQCMSHEMRHYYQHRKITTKRPVENKETIAKWKEDNAIKTRGKEKIDDYEYWFSARELDANLYSYIFTLNNVNRVSLNSIRNLQHFKALKKLYKQNGGKNVRRYFPNKIKNIVKDK